jgi:DNA helicase MCM8
MSTLPLPIHAIPHASFINDDDDDDDDDDDALLDALDAIEESTGRRAPPPPPPASNASVSVSLSASVPSQPNPFPINGRIRPKHTLPASLPNNKAAASVGIDDLFARAATVVPTPLSSSPSNCIQMQRTPPPTHSHSSASLTSQLVVPPIPQPGLQQSASRSVDGGPLVQLSDSLWQQSNMNMPPPLQQQQSNGRMEPHVPFPSIPCEQEQTSIHPPLSDSLQELVSPLRTKTNAQSLAHQQMEHSMPVLPHLQLQPASMVDVEPTSNNMPVALPTSSPPSHANASDSLLQLFAHYFPADWPGGSDVNALHESANRRVVREQNKKYQVVDRLSQFFHSHRNKYILPRDVVTWSRVILDYPTFSTDIAKEMPGLETEMERQPQLILNTLQCALHHICISPSSPSPDLSVHPFRPLKFALPYLQVRLRDYRPRLSLRHAVHAMNIGKFLAVQGTVVRVAPAHPIVQRMEFICARCGKPRINDLKENLFVPPETCGPPCNNKQFEPDRRSAECIDRQIIKLQEIFQHSSPNNNPHTSVSSSTASAALNNLTSTGPLDGEESAHVPRTLEVHLIGGDLVDCCVPGDVVSVCGFLRSRKTEEGIRGRKTSVFALYLDANAVTKTVEKDTAMDEFPSTVPSDINSSSSSSLTPLFSQPSRLSVSSAFDPLADFSSLELESILEFVRSTPNPFKMLVASLCPTIFGNEIVKAGLLMALVGGVGKHGHHTLSSQGTTTGVTPTGSATDNLTVRGDIHALLVGDPGLGKSMMLRSVSRVSPRGIYVSGGRTSKAGLTVTMVRDGGSSSGSGGGEYSLDAGALVLADQGVCCIDEFDKMPSEHSALLEVMEQQAISMAKANMVCRLSARTTVIAAANPSGGHYDRCKTLSENVRLSAPLLSRFDLVFILLDRPDAEQDARLSAHVVQQHGRNALGTASTGGVRARRENASNEPYFLCTPPTDGASELSVDSPSSIAASRPLARKLRVRPNDRECMWFKGELDLLPVPALRKYIAYARKYCRPLLSAGARSKLKDFFLHLRRLSSLSPTDSTPVTVRQLEGLVRLCEARARIELQEVVTPTHAQDVIDLMRESRAGLDAWANQDTNVLDENGQIQNNLEADMALASSLAPTKGTGRMGSKVALKRQFISILKQRADVRGGNPIFSASELYIAHEAAGLKKYVADFDAFMDALNIDNLLLKVGPKQYKLVM